MDMGTFLEHNISGALDPHGPGSSSGPPKLSAIWIPSFYGYSVPYLSIIVTCCVRLEFVVRSWASAFLQTQAKCLLFLLEECSVPHLPGLRENGIFNFRLRLRRYVRVHPLTVAC